jgi:lipopolysaccharide export system protein LptA
MSHLPPVRPLTSAGLLLALVLAAALPARAERADRLQPIVVEADKPGVLDLQRQVIVFNGNVQIVQGTMIIRAERIEVREQPGGARNAVATGVPGKPASYRQKRDGVDEVVEGTADRIEYDGAAGTLRFVGNGAVRRLRGGVVADEITGAEIRWDDGAQQFSVIGGDATSGGRVRAVLTPLPPASAASAVPEAGGR